MFELGSLLIVVAVIWLLSSRGKSRPPTALEERVTDLERKVRALEGRQIDLERELRHSGRSADPAAVTPWVEPVAPRPILPARPEPRVAPPDPARPRIPEPVLPAAGLPVAPFAPRATPPADPPIDWEKFLGVKLFAWLGGFALFLGAAFFVKYSIDHNLISPLMRVVIGLVVGAGLIVGGLLVRRHGYATTVQSLCAAGVAILYIDIYAARSFYGFIGTGPAFLFMILVTATAFLLALRLDALYVSLLGLVGGFLTPELLRTAIDNPVGLFGYIAILDIGLLAIALRKRWNLLVPLAAAATLATEALWALRHFSPESPGIGVTIWLFFPALFVAADIVAGRLDRRSLELNQTAGYLPLLTAAFAIWMTAMPAVGARPGLLLGFVLLLDLLTALLAFDNRAGMLHHQTQGAATFIILLSWTVAWLRPDLLPWALAAFLAFAILHTVFPLVLLKLRRVELSGTPGAFLPALAILLFLFPIIKGLFGAGLCAALVLVNVMAVAAAWMAGSVLWGLLALLFTLFTLGMGILVLPSVGDLLPLLGAAGFFAVAFFAWGLRATRTATTGAAGPGAPASPWTLEPDSLGHLPSLAALLPFALLLTALLRLPMHDPAPIFGLSLLLSVLCLALVRYRVADTVGMVALLAQAAVLHVWHLATFSADDPWMPLSWYLGFMALYFLFPFAFLRHMGNRILPFTVSALSLPVHFWLIWQGVKAGFGKEYIGLLPAALAVPPLAALVLLRKTEPKESPARLARLALYGATALFFITLVFPMQFDKEWITVGWALEGAALLWLFRRVPHQGLKWASFGLLVAAFIRLALNPAVLTYHPRASIAFFNWYLYAFGIGAAALFAAAKLLPKDDDSLEGYRLPPIFVTLGTLLLFFLLNIEIADYFSSGTVLTFSFSGSFAMDMAYSLGWGLFALVLLLAGIKSGSKGARLASLGLFSATILKVFLHDLWRLGQLYRVVSIFGLAVILILVSFLYQRFIAPELRGKGREDGTDA